MPLASEKLYRDEKMTRDRHQNWHFKLVYASISYHYKPFYFFYSFAIKVQTQIFRSLLSNKKLQKP